MEEGRSADRKRYTTPPAEVVEGPSAAMLASSSRLAEVAARALGNPLSVIAGRADMIISGEAADKHDVRASAEIVREQASRLGRLVEDLRLFGAKPEPRPVRTDLFAMAKSALAEIEAEAWVSRLNTSVACESREAAWADVDPDHIREALRRVLQNAAEAMKDGGALTVDVSRKRWQSNVAKGATS